LWKLVDTVGKDDFLVHIDCHETTDSDESEFRPAKAARDGVTTAPDYIPDGFYLVADASAPQEAFQKAMIDSVRQVTHIAPPDKNGEILEVKISQEGVIGIPSRELFLCSSVTNATYCTTTEVYPDSPTSTGEQCNRAQVACLVGGLEYVLAQLP
jgi:hypothetical protein